MYRLRCFGTMALEGGEESDYSLRSRKHWALLVYLLGNRGRLFPRERLAALFWDTEPRLARHSLSQALYDIRSTLPGVEFESSTSQVGAGADGLDYDGEEFERAVRSGELSRAVRLYGGRFAPDVEDAGNSDFTRWLESERQRYRRLAEMALYRHVRGSHDRGDWGEMCVSALRLLDMNPLNEDAHRALMRGLWLQGDGASAVRHFEDVEEFLGEELPGGVSQETLDLVHRIRTTRPSSGADLDPDYRRPTMVGREEEFGTLRRALEELREEGRGGLIRVLGEAGMGKTRLLEEFRRVVELDGARLLESRCYAAESDVPYGPVVEGVAGIAEEQASAADDGRDGLTYYQLGHLFPEAFEPPAGDRDAFTEPDAGRRRLYEEAADLLRRAAGCEPVVWLVEDVHWIDPSSASLLHYLVRRLVESPLLVVVTARTHEDPEGPARDLLEGGEPGALPGVVDIELGPLEPDGTAELLGAASDEAPAPETTDRIHVLAGGNPFYALELLRASASLEEEDVREVLDRGSRGLITESLRSLLERRLRGLASDAVRMMETVAVAGRHATAPLVRSVTEFPPARIAELAGTLYDKGLLRDVDGRLEFLHDITKDFVYGRMGDLQRSALHLSVGQNLEAADRATDPATLARHFDEGGDRPRAYAYALEAARDAERRHAHDEAMQMAEMAVELAAGEEEKAEALETLGMAQYSGSQFELACETFSTLSAEASADLYDEISIRLAAARGYIEQYEWHSAHNELDSVDSLRSKRDGFSVGPQVAWAQSLHLRLKTAMMSNDPSLAKRIVDRMRRLQQSSGAKSRTPEANGLLVCGLAAYEMFAESAHSALKRLYSLQSSEEFSRDLRLKSLLLRGIAQSRVADWDCAQRTFAECARLADQYNDIWYGIQAANNLMCVSMDQGEWDTAEQYYLRAEELGGSVPPSFKTLIYPRLNKADMQFSRGRYKAAAETYEKLLSEWAEALEHSNVGTSVKAGLGLCKLATGHFGEAADIHRQLDISSWKDLVTLPERNITAWFHGYMLWKHNNNAARVFLQTTGERELDVHVLSGTRTLWLLRLFDAELSGNGTGDASGDVLPADPAPLKKINSGWFAWFSRRWVQSAERYSISGPSSTARA